MVDAVSWDEREHNYVVAGSGKRHVTITTFIGPAGLGSPELDECGPQAELAQFPTPETIEPHFHRTDQFQIVVEGGGRIGRSRYDPITLQYTDGYTPYSIYPDPGGISFFVLRAKADRGLFRMPEKKDMKSGRGGRGLVSRTASAAAVTDGAATHAEDLLGPTEDGMRATLFRCGPGERLTGLSPEGTSGQFYVVTTGGVEHEGRAFPKWSVFWVAPTEAPPAFRAGGDGCTVVLTQFPQQTT